MNMIQPKTIMIRGLSTKGPMCPDADSHSIFFPDLDYELQDTGGPRKRKRLTHLSQEERLLRRKLKNRVAAQTARDRKKARMDSLEEAMVKIEAENKRLQNENFLLKRKTELLLQENLKMKSEVSISETEDIKDDLLESTMSQDVARLGGCANSESAELHSSQQQMTSLTLLYLTTHCLAFLVTLSATNSLDYSSKSQINSPLKALQQKLKQLEDPAIFKLLTPKLQKYLLDRWWGPKQNSWNPSKKPSI